MTEADGKPRARLALPYRRTPALICHRRNATCPAWPSAASAAARCEPVPAPDATCTRYRRRPARGTSAGAWNIAVRTRGVSTHRDDFQKPACAERGLVRTGTAPIISESAVIWTFRAITPATVGREESPSVRVPSSARSVAAETVPSVGGAGLIVPPDVLGRPDITVTSHAGGDYQSQQG